MNNDQALPANAGETFPAVFLSKYSRRTPEGRRETWAEAVERSVTGLDKLGHYTPVELSSILTLAQDLKVLPSGRWLWVGGTKWVEQPENYGGAYNCSALVMDDPNVFGWMMNMAMQGTGTGAVLEQKYIDMLPDVNILLNIAVVGEFGSNKPLFDRDKTEVTADEEMIYIAVGDSRQGWVDAYQQIINLAMVNDDRVTRGDIANVTVDISKVRPKGQRLKGFGGVANPEALPGLFPRMQKILNGAVDRDGRLTAVECCLLIDEASKVVVAGNLRRSAGMRQGGSNDETFAVAKDNLWQQGEDGQWRIDADRDALRMANHTRVFHEIPTLEEVTASVTKQFYSGEGAIQYAPEAIARANADLLPTASHKADFLQLYEIGVEGAEEYLRSLAPEEDDRLVAHRMGRYGLNPCFAAGTMVVTSSGHFPIESLIGKVVDVHDGDGWVTIDNFRVTAHDQDIFTIKTCGGELINATAYHRFVLSNGESRQLHQLKPGDRLMTHDVRIHGIHHEPAAYLKGFLVGDGTTRNGHAALDLYSTKWKCAQRLIESRDEVDTKVPVMAGDGRFMPLTEVGFGRPNNGRIFMSGLVAAAEDFLPWVSTNRWAFPVEALNWDLPSKLEFISGAMDSDGSVMDSDNGFGYQISSIHQDWLLGFQSLLHTVGVNSSVKLSKPGGTKDFGPSRGGEYRVQPLYRMTISQRSSIALAQQCVFSRLKSFAYRTCAYNSQTGNNKIEKIEFSHVADKVYCCTVPTNHQFSLTNSFVVGQCGEIVGEDFYCNLSSVSLKTLAPFDLEAQVEAFEAAGLMVSALLHHEFQNERQQYSREVDPIVGVSLSGLFDFFVNTFGLEWLEWWQAGRPADWNVVANASVMNLILQAERMFDDRVFTGIDIGQTIDLADFYTWAEQAYLKSWKDAATKSVWDYCDRHHLKRPNRCTTVQPDGTKALLTSSSPGWHPPKGACYIRRITYIAQDPLALALKDLGYNVIPGQTDRDETGALLDDPMDSRCTEWLVEFPIQTAAGTIAGVEGIDFNRFSACAQLDFYMQVQNYYTAHNSSSTIELREDEIQEFSAALHKQIGLGFMSSALLPRHDAPFPRMPFEVVSKAEWEQLSKEVSDRAVIQPDEFYDRLAQYDNSEVELAGPAQCDSDFCQK